MQPIEFPEANVVLAKDQPDYAPLPVFLDRTDPALPMTACFELSEAEKEEIARTGKLYYTQLTFGRAFQPVRLSTANPFI
jgi:hypothetical protein